VRLAASRGGDVQEEFVELSAVKQPQRPTWSVGTYAAVGSRILLTSELLCESVDLHAGERVLDVGCWSGPAGAPRPRGWR
jgi:hypothetical protein